MKKVFILLIIFSSVLAADDWKVDPNELPQSAIDFINKFFPNNRIILAERDRKKYKERYYNSECCCFSFCC